MVKIDADKCVVCGGCIDLCPSIAISMNDDLVIIDDQLCTECGICIKVCPMNAPVQTDNWYTTFTKETCYDEKI